MPAIDRGAPRAVRMLAKHALSPRKYKIRTVREGRGYPPNPRRMALAGLISRTDGRRHGRRPPVLTVAGRGFALSADLGVQFFEVCVLAKVYGVARGMAAGACGGEGGGGGGGTAAGRTVTIPLKTVQYFFEDWPVRPLRVQYALAMLRGRGLLPRSRYKRVTCDMARLDCIGDRLSEMDRWVDDTGEEIRRVLLHGD